MYDPQNYICPKCKESFYDVSDGYLVRNCRKPECLSYAILRTELDPRGGVLTYVEGMKYPVRGFPLKTRLDTVGFVKRMFMANVRLVSKFPLLGLPLLFYRKRKIVRELVEWANDIYRADYGNSLKMPEAEYSEGAREMMRAIISYNKYNDKDLSLEQTKGCGGGLWVYLLISIYDTDLAYRYRGQDIIPLINKSLLLENPRKELKRVLAILEERELSYSMKSKLKVLSKLFFIGTYVYPRILKDITGVIMEMNFDKIKFDQNDRYWVSDRYDYNFHGESYDTRFAWREEEHRNWEKPPIAPQQPRIVINPPNQAFYELSKKEAEKVAEETKQALLNSYESRRKESSIRQTSNV